MNALIVEDNHKAALFLKQLVEEHCPEIDHIHLVYNAEEAIEHLADASFDLVFLDIELPEMNAFELIEQFGTDRMPPIIFTTGNATYATEAFRINAIDYLMKPIVDRELKEAVNRVIQLDPQTRHTQLTKALDEVTSEEDRLVLASGAVYHITRMKDIIRAEGNGSYTVFYLLGGKKVMTSHHLKHHWEKLSSKGFLRTHQSHIVNENCIEGYDRSEGGQLLLREDHRAPVSKRMRSDILGILGLK